MPSVKSMLVTGEKLLAKLKGEYPNLVHTATSVGASITGAGVGFTLGQVAASAKKHDKDEDNHTVEYHPETR